MIYLKTFEGFKKTDLLAGVALIVENKILMVLPTKYKSDKDMWSIPKGHIEKDETPLSCALKELKEETGFILDKNYDKKIKVKYTKRGIKKSMEVFIYNLEKEKLGQYIDPESKQNQLKIKKDILTNIRKEGEIFHIKFFNLNNALRKVEPCQKIVIQEIIKNIEPIKT